MSINLSSSSHPNLQTLVILPLQKYPKIRAPRFYSFPLWRLTSYCHMVVSTSISRNILSCIKIFYILIYKPTHFFILSFSIIFTCFHSFSFLGPLRWQQLLPYSFGSFPIIFVLVACFRWSFVHSLGWCCCIYEVLTFTYKNKCLNISDKVDNFLFSDLKIALFEKTLEDKHLEKTDI